MILHVSDVSTVVYFKWTTTLLYIIGIIASNAKFLGRGMLFGFVGRGSLLVCANDCLSRRLCHIAKHASDKPGKPLALTAEILVRLAGCWALRLCNNVAHVDVATNRRNLCVIRVIQHGDPAHARSWLVLGDGSDPAVSAYYPKALGAIAAIY